MEKEAVKTNNAPYARKNKTYKKRNGFKFPKNNNAFAWLLIFVLFCIAVYTLRSVLLPFVAGIVLGYLFNPLASRFEKWGMNRTLSTILVFVVVILVAVPSVIMLFSVIDKQLTVFVEAAPAYISAFTKRA